MMATWPILCVMVCAKRRAAAPAKLRPLRIEAPVTQTRLLNSANEGNTSAGQFPLVHKLVKLFDIQRYYTDMRKALVTANRQIGGYKGWVTRWKNRFKAEELEKQKLEIEKKQLVHANQVLANEIREISEKFQDMGKTLAKLEAFDAAVDHLTAMKIAAKSTEDLSRAVDIFLETVNEIQQEDLSGDPQSEAA